ncbi:MAG: four helix bundle protein [Mariniphaga sp.]|nr:four helix bundle protein [Mariniphaga sp.]MDD4227076.1 four helix bundle protein [Mariniphaga sp.]MDD4426705.1 four helix bundle protein [Mariniphaga sp.]
MATINNFEDLEIWKLARDICKDIFVVINYSAFRKDFGLVRQINDSSGSIMDNIAEGFEREGNKEFVQFLSVSKGSCGECRSQLVRALDRHYITEEEFNTIYAKLTDEGVKIKNFMNYLKNSNMKGYKYK